MKKNPQNYLDLIPVRLIQEFTQEGEKTTLLVPKFKSEWARKWLIPGNRSRYFRIHLDAMGSRVWELIDGKRNTGEICTQMEGSGSDDDQLYLKVTQFLTMLYKNRFVTFNKPENA